MASKFLDRMEELRARRNDLKKTTAELSRLNREAENALQISTVPEDPEQKRLATLFQAVNDNPCDLTLSMISKNAQTYEIVKKAIKADGKAMN